MPAVLAESEAELAQIQSLLDKEVPTYRQAYSDRTAWIMACVSELAYLDFTALFTNESQKEMVVDTVSQLSQDHSEASLKKLIEIVEKDLNKELERALKTIRMKLLSTFDTNG
ncbi:MAG: hypothetical protein HRT90_01160, partial [Candidatus Margulisbacteria bacterium]|nr:hypothetical protein [Candidatus Margulisiibacteriota bacterium]